MRSINLKPSGSMVILAVLFAVGSWAAWAAQSGMVVRGPSFMTDVQMINGRPYVLLADVAKSMGLKAVRTGNQYHLVNSGTSDKVANSVGKIDTEIYSGAWTFRIVSAEKVTSYSNHFGPGIDPVKLQQVDDILIVVRCRLKNRSNLNREVYFDPVSPGNTVLTDHDDHAYAPTVIDSRNSETFSNRMPAGTVHEFALVFSVPKDTRMKGVVFTAGSPGVDQATDFRVALKP